MTSSPPRFLWLRSYLLGWLPVFGFCATAFRATGIAPSWPLPVVGAFAYLGPAALLGLAITRTAHWAPSKKHGVVANIGAQTALGIVYGAVWQLLYLGLLRLETNAATVRTYINSQLVWQMMMGMLIYHLLRGIFYAEHLAVELHKKEVAAARSESLRIRAEMEALRGQLDPHFLFNTLHSITALVREDSRRAEDALVQFAGLLRHVLALKRENGDELPLAKELAFVDDYLALEQLRLGGRLRVQRDISPDALPCWIPAFSVQPLVENALRHALSPRREGGTLTLQARVVAGSLIIVVADDGPGANPVSLMKTSGVGLNALRQRLLLRHGDVGQFQIETAPGRGFKVTLKLPAAREALVESPS